MKIEKKNSEKSSSNDSASSERIRLGRVNKQLLKRLNKRISNEGVHLWMTNDYGEIKEAERN